jgi:hypothetical protein
MSLNNNKRCTHPTIFDTEGNLSGSCDGLRGGVVAPSVPSITVTLQNENIPTFWTEENLIPVLNEDGSFIIFDNV